MFIFYKLFERRNCRCPQRVCPGDCPALEPVYGGFVSYYGGNGGVTAAQDTDEAVLSMCEAQLRQVYEIQRYVVDSPREAAINHGFFAEGRDNWLGGGSNPVILSKEEDD